MITVKGAQTGSSLETRLEYKIPRFENNGQ